MNTALRLVVLLLVLPSFCFAWSGKCVGVIDGDTIDVMNGTSPERIRLYGIDCPEKKQDYSRVASKFAAKMVFGKTVEVIPVRTEKRYEKTRTIAYVNVDGKSLNRELLKAGLAWWFRKYARTDDVLEKLEKEACQARLGLWSDPCPIPPWDWRHNKEIRRNKASGDCKEPTRPCDQKAPKGAKVVYDPNLSPLD
jgi:micrococcal nuclease